MARPGPGGPRGAETRCPTYERRGEGVKKVKAVLVLILVAVILGIGAVVLIGCQSEVAEQNAMANRLDAEAGLKRAEADRVSALAEAETQRQRALAEKAQAEAEAYQRRAQADTSAAAERAAVRQVERDATYERTLGLLPFMLLIVGVIAIGALAVVALAGRLQRPVAVDPGLVFLLRQQDRRLLDLERATYHQIATEQRRQVAAGGGPPGIIYEADSPGPGT